MKTINHECYVSPEVAKLLEQAGFDWEEHYPRNFCYVNDNTELFDKSVLKNYIGEDDVIYLAPTIEVAQRWLREVKHLDISIHYDPTIKSQPYVYFIYDVEEKFNDILGIISPITHSYSDGSFYIALSEHPTWFFVFWKLDKVRKLIIITLFVRTYNKISRHKFAIPISPIFNILFS